MTYSAHFVPTITGRGDQYWSTPGRTCAVPGSQ